MPLDQHVEGGHGERQARLKIRPAPMHDLFEMAHKRQHREDCLDEHTVLPLAALTQFQVGGVAVRGMEARVTQDDHASVDLVNEPLKGVIRHIGRRTVPPYHQAILVPLNFSPFVGGGTGSVGWERFYHLKPFTYTICIWKISCTVSRLSRMPKATAGTSRVVKWTRRKLCTTQYTRNNLCNPVVVLAYILVLRRNVAHLRRSALKNASA